jgi:glycosyltransferase involved in cell wall biosynthesis
VNDGSTDDTEKVLNSYLSRIKYISQENKGANPARNRGLKEAQGELVMVLDADVVLRADALELLARSLVDHPKSSYAYGRFYLGWKSFRNYAFSADRLRKMNYIHTSALVRRADHPGYDESIRRFQDWDVWLTMLGKGMTGVFVPEYLYEVRVDGASRIGVKIGKKTYGSMWIPSFVYSLPWHIIGFTPRRIKAYQDGRAIIAKKHGLSL